MKHIFTIHSSLTFLVAFSVIEHLKLKREEVILISSKYKVPIADFRVAPSFAERYEGGFWQKLRYFNVPVHFDRYINELTGGENFVAYIDLMSMQQRILITNKKCTQFHLFEEGNSAYMAHDDLNDLTWEGLFRGVSFRERGFFTKSFYQSLIRVLRGFNYRLLQMPYHYMAYTNFKNLYFFCFSTNAFYNAPKSKKVLLKPDPKNEVITRLAKSYTLKNETIWIDGSNARYTGLSETYYHKAIISAITILRQEKDRESLGKIYVKLRPGITETSNNFLASQLEKAGFSVELLPGDINLECLFITSENCRVIGVLTAALEYAHTFGHEAFTIYNLFEQRPPTFFDRMDGFWNHIKPLT